MSTYAANSEEISFKPYLTVSGILHGALILLLTLSAYFHWARGNQWAGAGGGGDNIKVNLVGSSGIPMPKEKTVTESEAVDPTKSLNKPEEKPKPPEPPSKAEKIPEFKKEKPLPPSHKSKVFENKIPDKPNAVPGHGGVPDIPTGVTSNPGSSSGVAIQGQGGGDFGAKYPWYVDAMRRRINQNWLQNTIDPSVRMARVAHCVVTFTIAKDGTVKNLKLTRTSGNASMDNSAMRAMLSANTMPALPPDYSGSYLDVTFDFDLAMKQ